MRERRTSDGHCPMGERWKKRREEGERIDTATHPPLSACLRTALLCMGMDKGHYAALVVALLTAHLLATAESGVEVGGRADQLPTHPRSLQPIGERGDPARSPTSSQRHSRSF